VTSTLIVFPLYSPRTILCYNKLALNILGSVRTRVEGDVIMNITSAFCDVHTMVPLAPATIKLLSSCGDRNSWKTAKCSDPTCSRHYTRDDGYFDSVVGKHPEIGDRRYKPRCGWNHEVECMVLTEIDGDLRWACPAEHCDHTLPFRIHFQSQCPHENCAKSTSHTFETAKLKKMLDRKTVDLYCFYCDRSWDVSKAEQTNLGKFIEEFCPNGVAV
jgi:hypothetical protein